MQHRASNLNETDELTMRFPFDEQTPNQLSFAERDERYQQLHDWPEATYRHNSGPARPIPARQLSRTRPSDLLFSGADIIIVTG
ncbi:hypothetical protein [Nocardia sp. CA-119907]|uniref:hypothetical protein n=1 Tax=Nocardia sp. CA-119907 TaxID=3239973 RepID=UPI003D96A470